MTEELVLKLSQETLKVAAMVASPMLIAALVVGVIISVLQAITQINEATLSFIPKMIVVGLVFVVAAPWILDVLTRFTHELFENLVVYVRN